MAIFVICLAVYSITLTPSLSYVSPDGNELATVPYILGLAHSTGYPLYTWLGKLFTFLPVGDIAHRINLMSAVMGAGAVALLYLILFHITKRHLPSVFAALLYAFSRTHWSQTGIAEVYAPNIFMVALTVWLLLKWAEAEGPQRTHGVERPERVPFPGSSATFLFLAFAFIFSLSFGTHLSNLGFAPAFAVFVLLVNWRVLISPVKLLGGLLAFGLGVAQFLWLPYKAATLNDAFMLRHAPSTLAGIYRYTLGAFPQFKFAFPIWALPDRVVIYLDLLRQNFGLVGILLGLFGMAEMLFRDTRKFFLFILMYLAHVFFFVQYRAFDLDVFFIPAHWVYAIFIGYGAYRAIVYAQAVRRGTQGTHARAWQTLLNGGMALLILVTTATQVRGNWEANDYSQDMTINDFYENTFQVLPEGSALIGHSGVFGYDMFYFRYVYNIRPDVLMPLIDGPRPSPGELEGHQVYSTLRAGSGGRIRGPGAIPVGLVEPQQWYIPVLVGTNLRTHPIRQGRDLILYRISDEPPELIVKDADPQNRVGQDLGGLELVGYDLNPTRIVAGGRVHITTYWRIYRAGFRRLVTSLDDEPLEAHELGFGNLPRYVEEFQPARGSIVVEDYDLVIPSTLSPGTHLLTIGLADLAGLRQQQSFVGKSVPLGEIEIVGEAKATRVGAPLVGALGRCETCPC